MVAKQQLTMGSRVDNFSSFLPESDFLSASVTCPPEEDGCRVDSETLAGLVSSGTVRMILVSLNIAVWSGDVRVLY